jgi:DNA-binding NtrC family response regulator
MRKTTIPATDEAMKRLLVAGRGLIQVGSPVLIVGEPGSGKRTLARYLHERGPAADQPLVRLDCGCALEVGPFADDGAAAGVAGVQRGTVFLDDLEALPDALQDRLLHFFDHTLRSDLRVLAAASPTLLDRVASGDFDAALYGRLSRNTLWIPPLRERPADLPGLVDHLFEARRRPGEVSPRIAEAAMRCMLDYDWPGNLRELKDLLERLVTREPGQSVFGAEDLPPQIRWFAADPVLGETPAVPASATFYPVAEEFQYRLIADALRRTWRR